MNNYLKKKKNFWKGKKVFITGHTGFKGSWLTIFLNILDAKIFGYSLKPRKYSLFNQANCNNISHKNFYADINDLKKLKHKIKISKPQIIFHLAAQPLVSNAYMDPINTFKTNIIGTANLIEAVRNCKSVKVVVIITTDKVYKIKKKAKPFKENDELGGIDPYSASKASTEILVNSYIKSFSKFNTKVKVATARSGNVLGGGDYSKDRIIPDILNAFNNKKKLIIRNPNHVRPWQHILEPLHGYIILAEKLFKNEIKNVGHSWNFGPKNHSFIKVYKLLEKINKIIKIHKISVKTNYYKETKILKLNSYKSTKHLKWKQKWGIDDTIKKIVDWNNDFKNKKNVKQLCEEQIKEYLS